MKNINDQDEIKNLGYKILRLPEIDSTNSYILREYNELSHKQVVITKNQTGGKGRKGRIWKAKEGSGLAMSILLKEKRINKDFAALPLVTGLAVYRAISPYFNNINKKDLGLKWVNDIVYSKKKLGGILCESRIFSDHTIYAVGIGMNINETEEFFKKNNLPFGISLGNITNSIISTDEIGKKILVSFDYYYNILKNQGFSALTEEYNEKCVNIKKEVTVSIGEKIFNGKVVEADERGNLVVENKEGTFTINSGEASIRGEEGYY